jgi:hypothetical protein
MCDWSGWKTFCNRLNCGTSLRSYIYLGMSSASSSRSKLEGRGCYRLSRCLTDDIVTSSGRSF